MSNKERWLSSVTLLIAILPFILVAATMQILPDRIPVLGFVKENASTPMLSKYQYLYMGLMGFVPAALVILARVLRARHLVERNFMYMVAAAMGLGIVFLLVAVFGVIDNILRYDIDLLKTFEFFSGSVIVASLFLGLLSNFLPTLRRNDIIGLKNRYTIQDNRVWVKVHYVAADVYMGTFYGFALFSSALGIWLDFSLGWLHLVLWVLTVSGLIVWGRLYSRRQSKKLLRGESGFVLTETAR